ncbi:restriction endonuclease [Candidatus Micrarchaeota archaeon]|nr:restriction endonuclease [Candidatus Micrarchaeota archaeon]
MDRYRSGRIAEGKVARDLKDKGFENVRMSAGSRGPADIYAKKGDTKYYIQVKSNSAFLDNDGRRDLRALAKERGGVAVSVHREDGQNKWQFLGNWKKRR